MIKKLHPPKIWKIPVILALGVFSGLFMLSVYLSKAHSYLSDDPKTCVNCHIMAPQYATWNHSSHREVTNCNDCHVPHNNVFNKYYFKAKDGLRHATMFTLRKEPQVIFIHEAGAEVVHQNCVRCHENQLMDAQQSVCIANYKENRTERKCWDCHREVPHGRVNSLSSTPYARVPLPESPVPEWIKQLDNN
ncbi:cytochrome c nitrite reductase small subunit [Sunxiuqinia elliptica]|uniref:Cytochrome c-type protein n=1 Tax=Sunxiuqinia elliptica TaxID=655355 RepID=A0A4R6GMX5_9BACT|nr:cytochrome c nitrite reductase small subunit [Sunxiuqinia elliptica]TDN96327.1 cytochrome c nitrite reductase small subunit [Sunxiuqinia elliptica]TDO68038.1 cytochrome c nitrite reductase small subunit [Sunxiuqinia elliptica]